jgi:hypothetical protein
LLFFGGRGRSQRNASSPVGGGGGSGIAAEVQRLRGTNGSGVAHIMIPVAPGVITAVGDLDDVVITVNGTEMAVELEPRGQHPDGSYSIIGGWCNIASVSAGSPISAEIVLSGTPTVGRTTIGSGKYSYSRNSAAVHLSGYPEVVLVPTSATYLAASQLTGPFALQTRAAVVALGGQYQVFWERFEDVCDWWETPNAGAGTYGHAPAADNPACWGYCNTTNTDYPIWGDLTTSADDFQSWRLAAAIVGSSFYPGNAYDTGKILIEAWLSTGQTKYLLRGLSRIAVYAGDFLALNGIPYSVDGYKAFPDGCAAYYLLTGDVLGKNAVEGLNDRFFRSAPGYLAAGTGIGYSAASTDPCGTQIGFDPRESARALQCALAGHRIRSTETFDSVDHYAANHATNAGAIVTRVLATGASRLRQADGTWRNQRCVTQGAGCPEGLYDNTFMDAMLCWELAKYYDQIDADAAIVTAVADFWSYARTNLWGTWKYSFGGPVFTAEVESFRQNFDGFCNLDDPEAGMGDSSSITLGFYPTVAAWLYARTSTGTYLTQADEAFDAGVGTGMNAGQGPVMTDYTSGEGPLLVARKVFGEAQYHVHPYFTLRLGA